MNEPMRDVVRGGPGVVPTENEPVPPAGSWFWLLFLALAAISVVPILRWEFVPAADYPTHISITRLLRLAFEDPAYFHATFDTRLVQPYWGFYLPVLLLSVFLPLRYAAAAAVAMTLLLIPVSIARLARRERLDLRVALLGFPLMYSFNFYWGFFPFLAGTALGLLGLPSSLDYAETRSRSSLVRLHVWSLVIFVAHATAWGFWLGWVGWILISTRPRLSIRDLAKGASAFVVPFLAMMAWNRGVESTGTLRWMREHPADYPLWVRWRDLVHTAFVSISPEAETGLFTLFVAAVAFLAIGRYEPGASGRLLRWLGLAGWMALAYFVVPHQFLGLNYTYERTLLFALLFVPLSAARQLRFPRAFTGVAIALALLSVFLADESARLFNDEMRGLKTCLSGAAPRSTLMGLIPERRLSELRIAVFLHTADYHTYWNLGRVYTHSMETLPTTPVYFRDRTLFNGPRPLFDSHPFTFKWPEEARNVRYFLIRAYPLALTDAGAKPTDPLLLKGGLARSRLVCESGMWRLYENLDMAQ